MKKKTSLSFILYRRTIKTLRLLRATSILFHLWLMKNRDMHKRTDTISLNHQSMITIIINPAQITTGQLKKMIRSVISQSSPHWKLHIIFKDRKKYLKASRITNHNNIILHLVDNKALLKECTTIINTMTDGYIAYIDTFLQFTKYSFNYIANHITAHNNDKIIFSDHGILSRIHRGKSYHHFKPDFSPDTFFHNNYIGNFVLLKKEIIDHCDITDYHYLTTLNYRSIITALKRKWKIGHIPKILYYSPQKRKSKTIAEQENIILQNHLKKRQNPPTITKTATHNHIHRPITDRPLISIIIPNKDNPGDLRRCIDSTLTKSTYTNYEIIIIENNSIQPETFEFYSQLEKESAIRVITKNISFNYSTLMNYAAQFCQGEYILLLNNDTEIISPDWLENMLTYAGRDEIGAVGAKLLYPDNKIQHAGVIVAPNAEFAEHLFRGYKKNANGYHNNLHFARNISAITAACLMVRKKVFDEVHGFDEKFEVDYGDIDFCLKLLDKGYLNIWTPYAQLYHYECKTRGHNITLEQIKRFDKEKKRFQQKWGSLFKNGDPYYNNNLDYLRADFSLKLY